jgi:xanthine dehydrogenase accessory factor
VSKEIELWQFIRDRLRSHERVVLLLVAESHGSSPGRAGYKMAVAENGDLTGSIGGGVMEVTLVEQAKTMLSGSGDPSGRVTELIEQEHRRNSGHPSGMICSGKQTVLRRVLDSDDIDAVESAIVSLELDQRSSLGLSQNGLAIRQAQEHSKPGLVLHSDGDFAYNDTVGATNQLIIIGGGHCALALSELMAKMDFSIRIFDDRPELNTLQKNEFADDITVIDSYEHISFHLESGDDTYVVVMTLGYKTDAVVIRQLFDKRFRYFGVLGSKAKMATLLRELRDEGYPPEKLDAIRTPMGLPINSHTPEEIAVSIAAEIISVKNA